MKKFPVYRFVKCDGYLDKNKDKWRLDLLDPSFNLVDKVSDASLIIAHKNDYIGFVSPSGDVTTFPSLSSLRAVYESEQELDFGDTVHQENYIYKEQPFEGFLVEIRSICLSKDIGPDWEDSVDVGIGVIPEKYYIGKWNEEFIKCGKVYTKGNGHYKWVPVENIHDLED